MGADGLMATLTVTFDPDRFLVAQGEAGKEAPATAVTTLCPQEDPGAAKDGIGGYAPDLSNFATVVASEQNAAMDPPAPTMMAYAPALAPELSVDEFWNLSDDDFMNALATGRIPEEIFHSHEALFRMQQRAESIQRMVALMTNLMKAVHEMHKAIIANIRG